MFFFLPCFLSVRYLHYDARPFTSPLFFMSFFSYGTACINDKRKLLQHLVQEKSNISSHSVAHFFSFSISLYVHFRFRFTLFILIKRIFSVLCKIYSRDKHSKKIVTYINVCEWYAYISFISFSSSECFLWLFIVHFSLGTMPTRKKIEKTAKKIVVAHCNCTKMYFVLNIWMLNIMYSKS